MRIAYFDCAAGISGDMCLGALVDAGVSLASLKRALKHLPVEGYSLRARKVVRAGFAATKVDVVIDKKKPAREVQWKDIERVVARSSFDRNLKERGLNVFRKLFEAEAAVHAEAFDTVHLHELGGTDCLVDVFGTLIGLDTLGVGKIYSSAINLGSGSVRTRHGTLPVPAPATAELLKGFPVYASDIPFELTTPTGAVLIASLDPAFAPLPAMSIEQIGYGAGARDLPSMPNTVRLILGSPVEMSGYSIADDRVAVVETNIDDMNPQIYEDVMDKLFAGGALDVFLETVIMKKSRPAVKLSVIVRPQDIDKAAEILFRETTTIGLRFSIVHRKTLGRESRTVTTRYGPVRIKVSRTGGAVATATPEYEDLKALSRKTKLPIKRLTEHILEDAREDIR
ncbi:MAG: nickel pincer cofactor biosynthesis protein LarC [Nitrospirota bacterium]